MQQREKEGLHLGPQKGEICTHTVSLVDHADVENNLLEGFKQKINNYDFKKIHCLERGGLPILKLLFLILICLTCKTIPVDDRI